MKKKELLPYLECGWSGNDYKPPCDEKLCSEYKNKKCMQARNQIVALIKKPEVTEEK